MLEKVDLNKIVTDEEYRAKIDSLKEQLTALDGPVKEKKLPVIVIFEGWSGAGKGSMIQKLILNFDPRWFSVVNTLPPTSSTTVWKTSRIAVCESVPETRCQGA